MSKSKTPFSTSTSIDSGVDDLQNPKFNYVGNFNKEGFRDRYGCQTWDQPFHHKYAGCFLYNNMHDKGFYFIKRDDGRYFYDGQIYNNKLEGYGQIIYKDGRAYEGLFKDNKRFGPGILTYPDEAQDVGLWNGNYLIRLSISISSDIVPSLCNSPVNKIRLLRYKKIVPALPERKDMAKELMNLLTKDEYFIQKYPQLYNPHVRNENSLFFDRRLYDLAQMGSEDAFIDVLEDEAFFDTNSDVVDAEDAPCPCINERCVHLNKQLSEMETELRDVQEKKKKYEDQLKICEGCCKIASIHSDIHSFSGTYSEQATSECVKYPSKASLSENADAKKHLELNNYVENYKQMATDKMPNYANKTSPSKKKGTASVNRLFINANVLSSGISSNNTDQVESSEKNSCACVDQRIPNVDFLLNELEKLKVGEIFLQTVIEFLNRVLYKEFSALGQPRPSKVVKIPVEDLLTWNNGKTITEILQHSFRYRNYENILNFNIKSLLTGERTAFGKMGTIENNCINFFKHCVTGDLNEVRKDLFYHNVYPDLADARGNTGLHLAVTCDRKEVIRQLANVGANLDAFNDECLTPLILGLLRYISALHRVVFWDKAFLPELMLNSVELNQVTQWRPHESLLNLGGFIKPYTNIPARDRVVQNSEDMSSVKGRRKSQSIKSGSISAKINVTYLFSTDFVEDGGNLKKTLAEKKVEEVEEKSIEHIARTIKTLVHYGADPNVGELPMRPMLLSVFSKNLEVVEMLLQAGGYPNTMTEDNLTPLHILASQPFKAINVQIAQKFLQYSSDPNLKTPNDFWFKQHEELVGTYISPSEGKVDCEGKTPLLMVAMRKDFDEENVNHQCDFVRLLIEYGAVYDEYFLGHTLLSLAVIRGNEKLIGTLHDFVELGEPLGENMGNALTVLGLQRFPDVLHFSTCKIVIDTLVLSGINPFSPVYDFANIYEFFQYDHSIDSDFDVPKIRAQLEANSNILRKMLKSHNSDMNKNNNKLSIEYLKDIGRDILLTLYQYEAINIFLVFASEDLSSYESLEYMAHFFTLQRAIDCLKLHIQKNKVIVDADFEEKSLKVLNFIKSKALKPKQIKRNIQWVRSPPSDHTLSLEQEIVKLRGKFEVPYDIVMYVLDSNQAKYEVCFHCLRKSNRILQPCPRCGLVKFCSKLCNKYNNKLGTKHSCNLLFYDEAKSTPEETKTALDLLLMERDVRQENAKAEEVSKEEEEEKEQERNHQLKIHHTKSTSTSFVAEKKNVKKMSVCCNTPSPIFVCDENVKVEQRKLNCGFHCGHTIPNVYIDEDGNIVRQKKFCECYPLYHGKDTCGDDENVSILEERENENDDLEDVAEEESYDSEEELSAKIEQKRKGTFEDWENQFPNPEFSSGEEAYKGELKRGEDGIYTPQEQELNRTRGMKQLKDGKEVEAQREAEKMISKVESDKGIIHSDKHDGKSKKEKHKDKRLKEKEGSVPSENKSDIKGRKQKEKVIQDKNEHRRKGKDKSKHTENKSEKDEAETYKNSKMKDRKKPAEKTSRKEQLERRKDTKKTSKKDESERKTNAKTKKGKKDAEKTSTEDDLDRKKDAQKKERKKIAEKASKKDGSERKINAKTKKTKQRADKTSREDYLDRKKDAKMKGRKETPEKTLRRDELERRKNAKMKQKTRQAEKKSDKHERKKSKGRKKTMDKSEESSSEISQRKSKKWAKSPQSKLKEKITPLRKDEKISSRSKSSDRRIEERKTGLALPKTVPTVKPLYSTAYKPHEMSAVGEADLKENKKISRLDQYFLELLSQYFPDFDMNCLMLPFACFTDGQLYYKFADASPFYCRTYSTM